MILILNFRFVDSTIRVYIVYEKCTTLEKLRNVLVHEMCHVAQRLISDTAGKNRSDSHGPVFFHWVSVVEKKSNELNLGLRVEELFEPSIYEVIEVPLIDLTGETPQIGWTSTPRQK